MKALLNLTLLAVAAVLAGSSLEAKAQTNKPATNQKPSSDKKHKYIPFHGELTAIDKASRTITVGTRTIQTTSETKFYKGENKTPATFDEAVKGQPVTGSYAKGEGDKLIAHSVYFKSKGSTTTSSTTSSGSGSDTKKSK
jgi:hypothetical protein